MGGGGGGGGVRAEELCEKVEVAVLISHKPDGFCGRKS